MNYTAAWLCAGCGLRSAARATLVLLALLFVPLAHAATPGTPPSAPSAASQSSGGDSSNGIALLEDFDRQQNQRVNGASQLTDHFKRVIMFSMSLPLFLLLLITGGLGIATGVYGKKLYIPHMVFAGLTVTLALAHAIAGIVWFFPF
jgi:hypothetical protein